MLVVRSYVQKLSAESFSGDEMSLHKKAKAEWEM